jgi:hypothetical protein
VAGAVELLHPAKIDPVATNKTPTAVLNSSFFIAIASVKWKTTHTRRLATFAPPEKSKKKPTWSTPDSSGINHVGLLCNRPPGEPECHLFSRPTTSIFKRRKSHCLLRYASL